MQSEHLTTLEDLVQRHQGRFFYPDLPVVATRAPGRLDVMGGIADYSGSLVLQLTTAEATFVAIQLDDQPRLMILSPGVDREGDAARFEMPLTDFTRDGKPIEYADAAHYFRARPKSQWAAYLAGAFLVLMREKEASFFRGARLLVHSNVPEGKGVSSSASVEVATMQAIVTAYDIEVDAREVAFLCQKVENLIAGAPCGIMDQMTVHSGRENLLLALLCQPAEIQGNLKLSEEFSIWGIDSAIRHAVSGSDYRSVRVGAFMGYKILQTLAGQDWGGYLANLSPAEFEQSFLSQLPEEISGEAFLKDYGQLADPVSTVDSNRIYPIRTSTLHPVFEHFRVRTFANLIEAATSQTAAELGELMYQSHASYSACGLGSDGTDLLVKLAKAAPGIYGAKISGGGSGGTVVLLGDADAESSVTAIAQQYAAQTGYTPHIFAGSSPGAAEFGSIVLG